MWLFEFDYIVANDSFYKNFNFCLHPLKLYKMQLFIAAQV